MKLKLLTSIAAAVLVAPLSFAAPGPAPTHDGHAACAGKHCEKSHAKKSGHHDAHHKGHAKDTHQGHHGTKDAHHKNCDHGKDCHR